MESKRFGDWKEELPCDNCENYYTGLCDSIKSECNNYRPTRHARLDAKIEELEKDLKHLRTSVVLMDCVLLFYFICELIRGL